MIEVPQKPYGRGGDREKRKSINFKVNGRSGIPACDAVRRFYVGLEGRDDRVFIDEPNVLMLRLEVRSIISCQVFDNRHFYSGLDILLGLVKSDNFHLRFRRPLKSSAVRSDSMTGRKDPRESSWKSSRLRWPSVWNDSYG